MLSSCWNRWFPINQVIRAGRLVGPLVSVRSFSGFQWQQPAKGSSWCCGGSGSEGWGGFRSSRDNDAPAAQQTQLRAPVPAVVACFCLGKEVTPCCFPSWRNAGCYRDFLRMLSNVLMLTVWEMFPPVKWREAVFTWRCVCGPGLWVVLGLTVPPCSWFRLLCIPYLITVWQLKEHRECLQE